MEGNQKEIRMVIDLQPECQLEVEIGDDSEMDISSIDIDAVESIPDVIIDSFEPETLPDVNDHSVFFLTQASASIFSDMKNSNFFSCLRITTCWKLYVSELMFGVLFYEAPWNETFQSHFLLSKLKDMGRIVVLKQGSTVDIPISMVTQTVTNCKSLSVTFLRHGLVSQMFEFEIKKIGQPNDRCTHLGTYIVEDVINGGALGVNKSLKGFPKIFKDFHLDECMPRRESSYNKFISSSSPPPSPRIVALSGFDLTASFSAVLENIRNALLSKRKHFKIVTSGADKLVSLWYMKHLAEEFNSQVHVDQHFFTFIQRFLPSFASAFSPLPNSNGNCCGFHFNCCESWSKKLDKGCVPVDVKPASTYLEVDFICIGYWENELPKNFRIPKSSHCIPYIHEVIYDF